MPRAAKRRSLGLSRLQLSYRGITLFYPWEYEMIKTDRSSPDARRLEAARLASQIIAHPEHGAVFAERIVALLRGAARFTGSSRLWEDTGHGLARRNG
jgi:hypothetical protein